MALFGPTAGTPAIAWQGLHTLPGAYALAASTRSAAGARLWVGGGDEVQGLGAAGQLAGIAPAALGAIQLDNHWLQMQGS
ncbi:hypothetical protein D3C85_1683000 [compost metagenome]